MTSDRGRGKTSTIGLALAAAIHIGFSNIFVTAPTPENIQCLWEFVIKGLKALNYQEFEDFTVLKVKTKIDSNKDSNRDKIDSIVQIEMKAKKQ